MEPVRIGGDQWSACVTVSDDRPQAIQLAKFEILCRIRERPFAGPIVWQVTEIVEDYRYHEIFYNYLVHASWREIDGRK